MIDPTTLKPGDVFKWANLASDVRIVKSVNHVSNTVVYIDEEGTSYEYKFFGIDWQGAVLVSESSNRKLIKLVEPTKLNVGDRFESPVAVTFEVTSVSRDKVEFEKVEDQYVTKETFSRSYDPLNWCKAYLVEKPKKNLADPDNLKPGDKIVIGKCLPGIVTKVTEDFVFWVDSPERKLDKKCGVWADIELVNERESL